MGRTRSSPSSVIGTTCGRVWRMTMPAPARPRPTRPSRERVPSGKKVRIPARSTLGRPDHRAQVAAAAPHRNALKLVEHPGEDRVLEEVLRRGRVPGREFGPEHLFREEEVVGDRKRVDHRLVIRENERVRDVADSPSPVDPRPVEETEEQEDAGWSHEVGDDPASDRRQPPRDGARGPIRRRRARPLRVLAIRHRLRVGCHGIGGKAGRSRRQ